MEAVAQQGMAHLRQLALEIAGVGLRAAAPRAAVAGTVKRTADSIVVGDMEYALADYDRVVVMGAGKASLEIGRGLEDVLGDLIDHGLIVVPEGEAAALTRIRTVAGDHPLPSPASVRAADGLLDFAHRLSTRDLVFACITGGSSALTCKPSPGVTFAEKRDLHRLLLASGAEIREINTVRKHVSAIKAGRLAATAAPATVVNLTICDVAGCAADLITDPTVPDSSTREEAVEVLRAHNLWGRVGDGVRRHLSSDAADQPFLDGTRIQTEILVDGHRVCREMAGMVRGLGRVPIVMEDSLATEARAVGAMIARLAKTSLRRHHPFPPGSVVLGCGGESTVSFGSADAQFGAGGPNQELILSAALELETSDRLAVVAIDTDGHDGGTAYAGGIADGLTLRRSRDLGVDIRESLFAHHSATVLSALGDHVVTGSTGTNVNDLVVVVLGDD